MISKWYFGREYVFFVVLGKRETVFKNQHSRGEGETSLRFFNQNENEYNIVCQVKIFCFTPLVEFFFFFLVILKY